MTLLSKARCYRNTQYAWPSARRAGFSLVEVMIVLAVLALMLAAMVRFAPAYTANARIKSATEAFRAALGQARLEAIKSNRPAVLNIDFSNARWQIINFESNGTAIVPVVIRTESLVTYGGIIAPVLTTDQRYAFNAVGQFGTATSASPPVITFATAATDFNFTSSAGACATATGSGDIRCLRVVVLPGGQSKLCDPALSYATNTGGC